MAKLLLQNQIQAIYPERAMGRTRDVLHPAPAKR
jgi:hypothetical protein